MSASMIHQQQQQHLMRAGTGAGPAVIRSPSTSSSPKTLLNISGSSPRSIGTASLALTLSSSSSSSSAISTAPVLAPLNASAPIVRSSMQSNVGVPQPSGDELAGRSYLDWLKSWDNTQVARWLADNRCASHAATFAANDIRGNVILDVDQSALKEMGVQSVGDRMRIVVAIKKLRQACMSASSNAALASRRPLQHSNSASSLTSNGQTANGINSGPSSPTYAMSPGVAGAGAAIVTQAQIIRRVSNGKNAHRIPPPLHLAQSSVGDVRWPQAYQSSLTPGSNASTTTSLPASSTGITIPATYGARSSSNHAALLGSNPVSNYSHALQKVASSPRSMASIPPAVPPPKTQPPPPPIQQIASSTSRPSASSSRNQLAAPTISTTAASPTAAQAGGTSGWLSPAGDYNSARKQARPNQSGLGQYSHRKAGSTGGSIGSFTDPSNMYQSPDRSAQATGRPSTAAASFQHHHPYSLASTSPTYDGFLSSSGSGGFLSGSSGTGHRPGTAPQEGRGNKSSHGSLGLSPISEANSAAVSPVTAEHPVQPLSNPSMPSSSASSQSLKAQQQSQGYTVGKGGFARPTTAAGTVSITPGGTPSAQVIIPFEEVMRKTVKFVGEDGVSKMVNVDGAKDAYEVFLRTLRKFGKLGVTKFPDPLKEAKNRNEYGEVLAEMDGYCVFASTADGSTKPLTELELFGICQSASRPERARGLLLRRVQIPASTDEPSRFTGKARKLRNFFGEDPSKTSSVSPTSPTHMLDVTIPPTTAEPSSPTPSSPSTDDEGNGVIEPIPPQKARQQRKTMNRASTVSIMSGLGWASQNGNGNAVSSRVTGPGPGSSAQSRSPSVGFIPSQTQKLRSFFGQRPPSELISTHLVDYFPSAPSEKKILSKAVRNNVRKSMMRRESSYGPSINMSGSAGKTSWEASRDSQNLGGLGLSRFSMSSNGSNPRASTDTIPPLPVAKDGYSLPISRFSEDYDSFPNHTRPSLNNAISYASSVTPSISVHSDEEEEPNLDTQSISSGLTRRTNRRDRASSRLSVWSHTKSNKDSDNASLLTVAEVTEDLEKRRISRTSWLGDHAGDLAGIQDTGGGDDAENDAAASNRLEHSEGSIPEEGMTANDLIEDDEEDEQDEDDEAEEDDEEDEEEEAAAAQLDVPQTVTTTTKKSTFRWVKGRLIGEGSFGQVYLGMNAANGSFMAVKQVELPTGSSHNEERKKSMLSALEREIELLKVMEHENIVQYLDSHSDGKHLHIFLEYVPGGSVAHLLANYGAFEEALVRTFVRQILRGLAYLHENEIIHRDIKGANILVDNRGGIKISDFGISKKVEENLLTGAAHLNRPSLQGSVFWMAPEVVKQTSYTAKADIWSLGCLIVEMFTGHHPWMELTQMQAIFKIGSAKDARPTIPPDFSPAGQRFLDLTFNMDYIERPTAAELAKQAFATEDWESPEETRD